MEAVYSGEIFSIALVSFCSYCLFSHSLLWIADFPIFIELQNVQLGPLAINLNFLNSVEEILIVETHITYIWVKVISQIITGGLPATHTHTHTHTDISMWQQGSDCGKNVGLRFTGSHRCNSESRISLCPALLSSHIEDQCCQNLK